jgi:hypothetical protein
MVWIAMVVGEIAGLGATAVAEPCVASGPPLLQIAASVVPFPLPKNSTILAIDKSGCRLRAEIGFLIDGTTPSGSSIDSKRLAVSDMQRLQAELSGAQIGKAPDCRVYLGCCNVAGYFQITWFGRSGRTHTFMAVDDPKLPPCPSEIDEIIFDPVIAEH